MAGTAGGDDVPLLRDRPTVGGGVTAYVCRAFVCDAPTTDRDELAVRIGAWRADTGE